MTTNNEHRVLGALEMLAWETRRVGRWVKVGALAMGLIAGMNFVSFLVDWWRALFGTGGTP
jgi:hypothetical protein